MLYSIAPNVYRADMAVVKTNIDVLVMEGLGPRADTDLLLARDTCLALLKLGTPKAVSVVTLTYFSGPIFIKP